MLKKYLFTILISSFVLSGIAQKNLLQSGPMVGYSEMKEVMLWVQTKSQADVQIKYINKNDKTDTHWTNKVKTEKAHAYTAHLLADELEPGREYSYELYINKKLVKLPYKTEFKSLPLWKWRGDAPDFSFITGSCAYISEEQYDRPGKPYGGDYQIFESMAKTKGDFMLWLGDNTYYREPDWNSKTGMMYRYTHTRSLPEMQALLASKHNYAIWDDHDYGPNDSDKSFPHKNTSFEVFKDFWANPTYGVGDIKGAITYFNWNDCDFYLLDNRWYRDANDLKRENKTMIGKEQLEWLKNALTTSHASFKFIVIGGQFLNTSGLFESYSANGFSQERNEIIEFIQNQGVYNVVFLTGDRHHSEVDVLKRVNRPTIYDLTISPLTSSPAGIWKGEVNALRVEGSLKNERNYAQINITGDRKNRKLNVIYYNSNGEEIYKYEIAKERYKRH